MSRSLGSNVRVRWDAPPHVVADEMGRLRAVALDLRAMADLVQDTYEDLYEAAHMPTVGERSGIPSMRDGPPSDPTGAIAISPVHRRMRRKVRRVAEIVRRIRPILADAEREIEEGFAQVDPEFQAKLRRLRELEEAIDAEQAKG